MLRLLTFTLLVFGSSAQEYFEKCPDATGPQPSDPPLPTFPTNEFQVRIEGNILNRGFTFMATEYYSQPRDKARLDMVREGQLFSMIFDYTSGQVYGTKNGATCQAVPIGGSELMDLFGVPVNGTIMTIERVFRFGSVFNQTYKGKATVRGLGCNWWRSCLRWKDQQANFTADWYWTDQNYTTPEGYQVPARLDINGQGGQGGKHEFRHVYEFFDFRDTILQKDIFETPSVVPCPGRKNEKTLPKLPDQYSYRLEINVPQYNIVTYINTWYDYRAKLIRTDSNIAPKDFNKPSIEIHDYNTGVRYLIDKTLGNCSISAVDNTTLDSLNNFTDPLGFTRRMKDPQELVLLNENETFAYNGQTMYRGVHVDRWVGTTSQLYLNTFSGNVNATVEVYFLADDFSQSSNRGDSGTSGGPVPVGMKVHSDQPNVDMEYHIYNWSPDTPDPTVFDITSCFGEADTQQFQIQFPLPYDPAYDASRYFLASDIQFSIAEETSVSSLRVAQPRVDFTQNSAYFSATMLRKAPALAQFTRYPKKEIVHKDDYVIEYVGTVQRCAELCLTWDNFTCNSFDYCAEFKICELSKLHVSDGDVDTKDKVYCDHYSRTVDGGTIEPPLETAFEDLKNAVYSGYLTATVFFNESYMFDLTAVSIRDDIQRFSEDRRYTSASWLKQFQLFKDKAQLSMPDAEVGDVTVDQCANECLIEMGSECGAFSYCYGTGVCRMKKLRPVENKNNSIVPDEFGSCDVYARNFISRFTMWKGTTLFAQSDADFTPVTSAEECAHLCVTTDMLTCKSFNYCPALGNCGLQKVHRLEVPAENVADSPQCNHYSRNYIDDFQYDTTAKVSLSGKEELFFLSVEQCAKACVDNSGSACSSFASCDNYTTPCIFNPPQGANIFNRTSTGPPLTCRKFKRVFYDPIIPRTITTDGPGVVTKPTSSKKTFSTGVLAGAAVGGVVAGFLIAFLLFLLISRLISSRKPHDDMQVQFVKADE